MSNTYECVDYLEARFSPEICTDVYSDLIFAHSILNLSENSICPSDDLGEDVGAYGKLYFPNGKQSCTVVLSAKCGGPAFRVNPFLS